MRDCVAAVVTTPPRGCHRCDMQPASLCSSPWVHKTALKRATQHKPLICSLQSLAVAVATHHQHTVYNKVQKGPRCASANSAVCTLVVGMTGVQHAVASPLAAPGSNCHCMEATQSTCLQTTIRAKPKRFAKDMLSSGWRLLHNGNGSGKGMGCQNAARILYPPKKLTALKPCMNKQLILSVAH